jgi:hypothetical protein
MEFDEREVTIKLSTEMLGTVSKDPEVYKTYIESKKPANIEEDESLTVDKTEEKGWTGFHRDKERDELFIYDYMCLGFLKNAGEVLQHTFSVEKEKKGVKVIDKMRGIRGKIDKYVFVFPRRIYLNKSDPDGYIERPLRVMTAQGPRVTLTRSDYIKEGLVLKFTVKLLKNKEINWDTLKELLSYGELAGLGQFRNGGYGRFEVLSIEPKTA